MSYEPKGRAHKLLTVLRADPMREVTPKQAAEIMGCEPRAVSPTVRYALRRGELYRTLRGKAFVLRVTPFEHNHEPPPPERKQKPRKPSTKATGAWTPDPTDPRISRVVAGWVPPQMICTRLGQ